MNSLESVAFEIKQNLHRLPNPEQFQQSLAAMRGELQEARADLVSRFGFPLPAEQRLLLNRVNLALQAIDNILVEPDAPAKQHDELW